MPSIVFSEPQDPSHPQQSTDSRLFSDLNLDQVLEGVGAAREEYDLAPLLRDQLQSVESIKYRHEVFRDLEDGSLLERLDTFAQQMREMRQILAEAVKLRNRYQKQSRFLDAVNAYREAVVGLDEGLAGSEISSRGLRDFRTHLSAYASSPEFRSLVAETRSASEQLSRVTYLLQITGNRVRVRKYDGGADYSAEVLMTFDKFKQNPVNNYLVGFPNWPDLNRVEATVLDLVARLFSETFAALAPIHRPGGEEGRGGAVGSAEWAGIAGGMAAEGS